jgi:hypothetical protein
MDIQKVVAYIGSTWGILSSIPLVFPFANQVAKFTFMPTRNDEEGFVFATINSIVCAFIILVSISFQSSRRSLFTPLLLFGIGLAALVGYILITSPINALLLMGVNADVSYLVDLPVIAYQAIYLIFFGSLTGAFASLYRP